MRRAKEKNLVINDVTFELYDDGRIDDGTCRIGACWDDIYSIYGRPSQAKVSSWHSWCAWIDELRNKCLDAGMVITSHNTMMYSIYGEVRDTDGTKYELWITRDHNRAFRTHKPMA